MRLTDESGSPLSEEWLRRAKDQHSETIRGFLDKVCDKHNADVDEIVQIHRSTPPPTRGLHYECIAYDVPTPVASEPERPKWWLRWLNSHVQRVDAKNAASASAHKDAVASWQKEKDLHDVSELRRKHFIEFEIEHDAAAREIWIEEHLASISWPRETRVDYQLSEDGADVILNVDLPEIEDMPSKTARPAERGLKVIYKAFGMRALELNYARHIHGLLLRLVGEMFASLPMLQTTVISGFTQRPNPATGDVEDQYVLSLHVERKSWEQINFESLDQVDPLQAVTLFAHRRDMTGSGRLRGIVPLADLSA